MKIVIDMNLSPSWVEVLIDAGFPSVHWSVVGKPTAKDHEIMAWARSNDHVVFTHDLDFGVLLALTHATGPSVLQVRTQNVLPDAIGASVLNVFRQHIDLLERGALITVDEKSARVRILPIR